MSVPSEARQVRIARIQAVMRRRRIGDIVLEDSPITAGELTIRPDRFDAFVDDEPAGGAESETGGRSAGGGERDSDQPGDPRIRLDLTAIR